MLPPCTHAAPNIRSANQNDRHGAEAKDWAVTHGKEAGAVIAATSKQVGPGGSISSGKLWWCAICENGWEGVAWIRSLPLRAGQAC